MSEEIPVSEIRWLSSTLKYKRYGNSTDYFEHVSFDQFSMVKNKMDIPSKYLYKKSFLLGIDKYGRDLLSRLLVG